MSLPRGGAALRAGRCLLGLGVLIALAWIYRLALFSYLGDQHYQEHFAYLWAFFGLALSRSLRGPFRTRLGGSANRDRAAWCLAVLAGILLWVSSAGGSSTGQRSSLVLLLLAGALVAIPAWSWQRCVLHCLLLQLCFGLPYSLFFPLTKHLQWGVAALIGLPAQLGLVGYRMVGHVAVFPHYHLAITTDCSGIGQLLTFVGIAALGVLTSAPNPGRAMRMLAAAIFLAWASNLARVAAFMTAVGCGWTAAVDVPALHAGIGFVVFLPFVGTLVWLLLRSHQPLPKPPVPPALPGRFAWWWLATPVLLASALGRTGDPAQPEPPYFQSLTTPPDHRLTGRATSETADRESYATPWLIHARFADERQQWFDLLHFATRSRRHLCVHKVADCLYAPGADLHYADPIAVDGTRWWRLAIDSDADATRHVYFAFEVDGERTDDSWQTAWRVFQQRLMGGTGEVRLWRVTFPGSLPPTPTDRELRILRWLNGFAAPARGG